jgi:hypothetical protein
MWRVAMLGVVMSCTPEATQGPRKPGHGELAPEEIQKVLKAHHGELSACSSSAKYGSSRVTVLFTVDREGRVSKVVAEEASRQGLRDPRYTECIEGVVRALVFPRPKGGIVTVRYPIVFE